uniref:Reverse transcriptase domain-containing protein n=1 Tax=Heterorhabditis bacteriophora TaxID=37862 RepID=A0A1I7WEL2_HETBA
MRSSICFFVVDIILQFIKTFYFYLWSSLLESYNYTSKFINYFLYVIWLFLHISHKITFLHLLLKILKLIFKNIFENTARDFKTASLVCRCYFLIMLVYLHLLQCSISVYLITTFKKILRDNKRSMRKMASDLLRCIEIKRRIYFVRSSFVSSAFAVSWTISLLKPTMSPAQCTEHENAHSLMFLYALAGEINFGHKLSEDYRILGWVVL